MNKKNKQLLSVFVFIQGFSISFTFTNVDLIFGIIMILPIILRMKDDAEPENTTADPECESGTGTSNDPFILEPVKELEAGEGILSKETFTITNISSGLKIAY